MDKDEVVRVDEDLIDDIGAGYIELYSSTFCELYVTAGDIREEGKTHIRS